MHFTGMDLADQAWLTVLLFCRTEEQREVKERLLNSAGLNMLNQAREFNETVSLSGLVLTKLDGTARGGAVVSVVDELKLPVKFIGVGETVDDLQPFNADAFVNALFPEV